MATFGQNLASESREGLRDYFESNTGIIGQALRSKREKTEQQKQAQAQAERINTSTGKLRTTSAALSSMEASFIQISKNMQLIAQAMGAEVTLQEETDKDRKKLDEIAKRRLALQQELAAKRQKDLSSLNRKVNDSLKQHKQDKSVFEKIIDVLDDLPGGRRGGRGGRGGGRAPGGRVPTSGAPSGRIPPGVRAGLGTAAKVVGAAGLAYGTYEAAKFARQAELGRRLNEGQGGAAQAVFRGRDQVIEGAGGERRVVTGRDVTYGADISPESARAVLDQPDSPGKRRDIQAFGGKDRLEKLAKQAREQAPSRTRQEIYGQAAGRQQQVSGQTSPARNVQENVFTGPMVARQRDVQENVFTGPMVARQPAPATAATAPRPAAAQQRVEPGSTITDKKTDDQGAKNPGPGAPQRKEGPITRPRNVIIGPNADLSPDKINQGLLQRVYLAAEKYGKPVTITSGFRPDSYQALLYVRGLGGQKDKRPRPADWPAPEPGIYIPSLPKTAQTVTWKGRTFDIPGSGRHNVHLEMSELDISPGFADAKWVQALREFGVVFPYGAIDPPHASIMRKNRDGADAPPLASLVSGAGAASEAPPSNVLMSGSGIPVTTGTGGFVTSGEPAPQPATPVQRPPVSASPSGQLGKVAEKYETGGRGSGIVGWDSTGGTSYGKYQIASKVGAMTSFLKFIESRGHRELAAKLRASGIEKDTGSNKGPPVDLWKQVVAAGELGNLEHEFIKNKSYDPALSMLKDSELKAMINSNRGLQEMLWSTAVQHGPAGAANILNTVYQKGMTVNNLIQKVYDARGTRFGNSTAQVQRAVLNRFKNEQADILAILPTPPIDTNNYGSQPTIVVQNNNNTTVKKPGGTQVAGQRMALVGA